MPGIDEMRQWYFENISEFRAEVGFETRFDVECEGRVFPHLWKVTEVAARERITYDWSYAGYPGDSFVVFELSGEGDFTRVRLTHRTREDFPDDVAEFSRESGLAGWRYFIRERLKGYVEGGG